MYPYAKNTKNPILTVMLCYLENFLLVIKIIVSN